ncbi:hypothetical protein BGZ54_003679 [Gamsiella multidivaricata]|nr:hypothetical protein BGZ54_003679 [Gamsiella multidivaricata]
MRITDIPAECILRVVEFLDLPDQHSLLLTCSDLFSKVVPDSTGRPSEPSSPMTNGDSHHLPYLPYLNHLYPTSTRHRLNSNYPNNINVSTPQHSSVNAFANANNNVNTSANTGPIAPLGGGGVHRPQNISTSSVSSTASTTSTATSSYSSTNNNNDRTTNSPTTATSSSSKQIDPFTSLLLRTHGCPSPPRHTTAQKQSQGHQKRPASLQRRSYSEHPKGTSSSSGGGSTVTSVSQVNLRSRSNNGNDYSHHIFNSSISNTHHYPSINSNNNCCCYNGTQINIKARTTINPLAQLKLNKITRLLQLLISCTSVQARLPALRYPGYGQQWIRPPCYVDYLQHYIDQQESGQSLIQCFHLLFANLVQCRWDDEAQGLGVPIAPPDKEAYRVLHQIQKEFMTHSAAKIRTLSVSVAHTVEHATELVPQLAAVTKLELTDVEDPEFKVDEAVDFIKSHRMLFGHVIRDVRLVDKAAVTPSSSPTSPSSPPLLTTASPTINTAAAHAFAAYASTTRFMGIHNNHNHLLAVMDTLKNLERIDATAWANCILHLDAIPTTHLKRLWLSFAFPPSETVDSKAARLSEYLDRCRRLEEVRIPIRRADVFHWALQEKKTALICAPILASSKTKRLPRIRRIHLQGPSLELMDCVQDAVFAFQDTLEDLEARSRLRVWQPTTLSWKCILPRLTCLRLEGEISMHFCMETLERCPALEELSLATATAEDYRFQQSGYGYGHRHGQIQQDPGSNLLLFIRSREMYKIGSLKWLRSLSLIGPWQIPDMALRRIADRCEHLKELALDQTMGSTIGGVLLAVERMQRLEKLDLCLDIVDLRLVKVAARKLRFLSSVRLTNLRSEEY